MANIKKTTYNTILVLSMIQLGKANKLPLSTIENILDISLTNTAEICGSDSGISSTSIMSICNKTETSASVLFSKVESIVSLIKNNGWTISEEAKKNDFLELFELFQYVNQLSFSKPSS